jgi:hypothetical protein
MFFQLLFIHLYRPFLKYTRTTSPLPSHVSPRKFCTQAAAAISKLFRLYKRTHGLRQICNIAVYIAHSACTIHLLNLPDKNARRDIIHGVKHLEEIGECWTCARRTLRILELSAEKWKVELPDEALASFARTRARWGFPEPAGVSPINTHGLLDVPSRAPFTNSTVPTFRPLQMAPAPAPISQPRPQPVGIIQYPNGLTQRPTPSPATTDKTHRSSGNYSLPPHSAADLARAATKNKQSVHLTKQQQDAWNAHRLNQARRSSATGGVANANLLFGGVDSLVGTGIVEESQDWWLKDQSSIAHGFENWVDPNIDWSSIEADMNAGTNGFQTAGFGSVGGSASAFAAFPGEVPPLKQSLSVGTAGVNGGQFAQGGYDDELYF